MRVWFRTSGGVGYFPGLAAPRAIDVDALGAEERDALRRLAADARFFDLPPRPTVAAGAADYQTYEITIEDEGRRHTAAVADPIADPALQRLVGRLRALIDPRRPA